MHNRKQLLDVSRSERICRICDEGVIGDEIHFFFECQKLEDLRIKHMVSDLACTRSTQLLNLLNKFHQLLIVKAVVQVCL